MSGGNTPARIDTTQLQTLDAALHSLEAGKRRLAHMLIPQRITVLEQCIHSIGVMSREWVEAACAAKRYPANSPARAEEVLAGPTAAIRQLQLYLSTMRDIERTGTPRVSRLIQHPDGKRLGVQVTPTTGLFDPFVFINFRAIAWMQAQVAPDNLSTYLAPAYQGLARTGISLVLGAGNVSSIPVADALTRLCVDNRVVLLKMNPVNEYLAPIFERAFAPLIENDLLRVIRGDAEVGKAALHDARIDDMHITGSSQTHETIVWGPPGHEREHRKRLNQPLVSKPISSELGNVTPWIFLPGAYSRRQIRFQAENVVSSMINNAGFNCVATRVIVTWKQWPQREHFLQLIESTLSRIPQRFAYYPGAFDRYERFAGISPDDARKALRPSADGESSVFGSRTRADGSSLFLAGPAGSDDTLPWTLMRNVSPHESALLFEEEAFVCVCAEVPIDANGPEDFLNKAVDFANQRLRGTLAATVTVPPEFQRHPQRTHLHSAIARLQYGLVALNQWSGLGFGLMSPPWGGYVGGSLAAPGSGVGSVHNSLMLTGVEQTLLQAPLTVLPKPVWLPSHPRPEAVSWSLFELFRKPSLVNAAKLGSAAFQGALSRPS